MLSEETRSSLAHGGLAYRAIFAKCLLPDPVITISEWAERYRVVPTEASAKPGKWSNDVVPFLREVMDCLSPHHPCEEVTFCKSAQVAGTECGVNFFGAVAHLFPGPMGIYLPSIDLLTKYNAQKLNPTIQATKILRRRVAEQKSRDEKGSTNFIKKFPGGLCFLATSSSSSALQSVSLKYLIKDEISEWPATLDDRGDPDVQADTRTTAFIGRGRKIFNVSTPAVMGSCRITSKFMAGDQRRYYVPCPHCGNEQTLVWERLDYNDEPPYEAVYSCAHCGADIEHRYKSEMVAKGRWIAEAKGAGRQPSFHINQLYSPFVPWDHTVAQYMAAKGRPEKERAFFQQVLGLAYEEKGDAPDYEKLLTRVEPYKLGQVPPKGVLITGAADVQGNRIEYGVYAFGDRNLTRWLIDKGVIEGSPDEDYVWQKLAEVIDRKYQDAWGKFRGIDAFGIDSGFRSHRVYQFVRRNAHRERVYALDGRGGPRDAMHPPIGTPKPRDIDVDGKKVGSVLLWPVGTWPMKSEFYASLRKTIEGPNGDGLYPVGAAHYPEACDRDYFKQLTSEYLHETDKRNGYVVREWRKISNQPNEALDIAVYAAALAHREIDPLTDAEWNKLVEIRCSGSTEKTLFSWAGAPTVEHVQPPVVPVKVEAPKEAQETVRAPKGDRQRKGWIGARCDNWLRRQ